MPSIVASPWGSSTLLPLNGARDVCRLGIHAVPSCSAEAPHLDYFRRWVDALEDLAWKNLPHTGALVARIALCGARPTLAPGNDQ